MYGGVADRYKFYKQVGEPFKENNKYYVMMQPPYSRAAPVKVRFYTDKAHGSKVVDYNVNDAEAILYKLFGFENADDHIQVVYSKTLSEEENAAFENSWRSAGLFGGIWYASKAAALPVPLKKHQIADWDWKKFKAEAAAYCRSIGASADCIWFKI